jgi:hypothetical protein
VPVERLPGRGGKLVGVGAGGVQRSQQRQGVSAHCLLDQWRLVQARDGEGRVQAGSVGRQATLAAGLAQQLDQLGWGQLGRVGGCGGQPPAPRGPRAV